MGSINVPVAWWCSQRVLGVLVVTMAMTIGMVGCSKSPFDVAPARGRVTLDGRPLTSAKVMFAPIAKGDSIASGKPAFGLLEPDGGFTLSTYTPEDGAVIGEHWVTVIRMPAESGRAKRAKAGQANGNGNSPQGEPALNWDRVMFPQRVTVTADGENKFSIALTSELIAKYARAEH